MEKVKNKLLYLLMWNLLIFLLISCASTADIVVQPDIESYQGKVLVFNSTLCKMEKGSGAFNCRNSEGSYHFYIESNMLTLPKIESLCTVHIPEEKIIYNGMSVVISEKDFQCISSNRVRAIASESTEYDFLGNR